jgi:hypothetical protein
MPAAALEAEVTGYPAEHLGRSGTGQGASDERHAGQPRDHLLLFFIRGP